ncbi:MAG: hypothetical protein MUE85_15535 [Microscillaceae bacterium]|jgi:hypothetical protein|nr:hypothetical protein [Microscillaceae bacterium]
MKKPILLFLFVFSLLSELAYAQKPRWEFNVAYDYSRPQGEMAVNIRRIHGAALQGLFHFSKLPLSVGLELGFGGYGYQSQRQTYTFNDGSQTETDVNVSNNIGNILLVSQLNLLKPSMFNPYIQLRAGMTRYYTNLYIEDPQDVDNCHPLEQDILISDRALMASLGTGVKWDLSSVFKKIADNRVFLDLGINYTLGPRVRYMNVNEPAHQEMNVEGYEAQFINNQTQIVHKHHVGYVYSSPIEMFNFRFGFSFQFGN